MRGRADERTGVAPAGAAGGAAPGWPAAAEQRRPGELMAALMSGDGAARASGVTLVAGGAPGGGRWPSSGGRVSCGRARGGRRAGGRWRPMVGQRAARTNGRADWRSSGGRGGRHSIGAGSGGRAAATG